MGWALVMEGRTDPAAIVVVIKEREEAAIVAAEICRRGPRVVADPTRQRRWRQRHLGFNRSAATAMGVRIGNRT